MPSRYDRAASGIPRLFSRFRAHRGGNVALLFGVALVPVVVLTGMGVDYMRASSERTRLQQAIDSTALALAHEPKSLSASELQARAEKIFAASFSPTQGGAPKPVAARQGSKITVTGEMVFPTSLMQLAGQKDMVIHASATVSQLGRQMEIALVLDNTGSMGHGGKLTAVKAAANMFLEQMAASNPVYGDIRVSLVPYNLWVNVGKASAGASWLDMSKVTTSAWKGCVEDRQPDYDVNADPGAKYPAVDCPRLPDPIMPLTDIAETGALDKLKKHVTGMDSNGSTNVTIGLVWGLATITPNGPLPGVGPRPFGSNIDKMVILLTDGDNTSRKGRWGSVSTVEADKRTALACENVKDPAKKVRLITIRVVEGDDALLAKCASSPSDFYRASSASAVKPIFEKILSGLGGVRLTN